MKRIFYSLFLLFSCYVNCFAGMHIETNVDGEYIWSETILLTKGAHTIYFWKSEDGFNDYVFYKDLCTRDNPWTKDSEWIINPTEIGSYGQMIADIDGYYTIPTYGYGDVIYPELNGSCGENLTWAFDTVSGNLAIYGSGTMTSHPWKNISPALIKSITLPPALTSICDAAFYDCSSLTSITIPNSVTSIGGSAFYNCSSLTKTNYTGDIAGWCNIKFSDSYANPMYYSHNFYINDQEIKDLVIPNSIDSIHNYAFYYCSALTSITIPNSVTSIGEEAFRYCSSLTSITCLGTTPPTLGTGVFNDTKLSVIYIPDNTLSTYQTAWGNEYVFVYNENTLTLHVATPGTLSELIFDAGKRPLLVAKLTLTGTLNDDDFTCMRETMTSLVDVDLSGITNTSGVNFNGKARLMRIILPTNLTSIGDDAFYGCSSLTSVTIPNSVTSIEYRAFEGCSSLTSVTIPNSVTSIGDGAFAHCSSLTSVTIGNSVTSIGIHAFDDCSSLTFITIGNSVTSIGGSAFIGCSSLTSVTIPNSVTSIEGHTFYGCSSLTSVTISNSVTNIGWNAFEGCSSLTSVTIPNSVTSIGEWAFAGCSSLTSIICLGTTPPDASDLAANTSTCKLIVPHSAYNAYIRHAYWGQFLNIVADSWVVILNTNNNQWGEVAGGGMYSDNTTITITATPYEGCTFLRWSDGNTDNPRTLTVTKDITLTAEFVENRDMTIIFTNSEDNDSEIYSQSLTLTIPAAPEIEGFTFLYWQPVAEPLTDVITIQAIYKSDIPTANEVYINPANPAQKLLRNGQVYILQDGQTYTIQGHKL